MEPEKVMTFYLRTQLKGKVEKTDPRTMDYPLTPILRTTLRTTLQTTLRTTPTDCPK